jgi:hypothetical protein
MDSKENFHMLSKEDLLIGISYKLDYLLCIGVMLPNFVKTCLLCFYAML